MTDVHIKHILALNGVILSYPLNRFVGALEGIRNVLKVSCKILARSQYLLILARRTFCIKCMTPQQFVRATCVRHPAQRKQILFLILCIVSQRISCRMSYSSDPSYIVFICKFIACLNRGRLCILITRFHQCHKKQILDISFQCGYRILSGQQLLIDEMLQHTNQSVAFNLRLLPPLPVQIVPYLSFFPCFMNET